MPKEELRMFNEFKKMKGLDSSISSNDLVEEFKEWLMIKRFAAINYVKLFDMLTLGDEPNPNIIAEFGKGFYDTITIPMVANTTYEPIIITQHKDEFTHDFCIPVYDGSLELTDDMVFVKYKTEEELAKNPNTSSLFNESIINTFMTQLPFTQKELLPFLKLVNSKETPHKTLFIGTYGAMTDEDRFKNLKILEILYIELCNFSERDVNFCSETERGTYFSAIKINSQEKILKLKKSR